MPEDLAVAGMAWANSSNLRDLAREPPATRRPFSWQCCGVRRQDQGPRTLSDDPFDSSHAILRRAFDLVLPETNHDPPRPSKASKIALIAPSIPLDLCLPIRRELVFPGREPPPVPVVAVNKYRNTAPREHEVWPPWKRGAMFSEAESPCVHELAYHELGLGVDAPYAGHHVASLCRRKVISHAQVPGPRRLLQ